MNQYWISSYLRKEGIHIFHLVPTGVLWAQQFSHNRVLEIHDGSGGDLKLEIFPYLKSSLIEQTMTYRFSLFYEVKFVLRLAFHNRTKYYLHIFGRTNYNLYLFLQNKLQPTCRTNYNLCRTNYYHNLQNKLNLKNRTNYGRPFREL